jgi:hypothetical protein
MPSQIISNRNRVRLIPSAPTVTLAVPLGLLYTDLELDRWVDQLNNGRYVTRGDVGRTNSPDDWNITLSSANQLKNNSANGYIIDRYEGPSGTGVVGVNATPRPNFNGKRIQDCAFIGRVLEKKSPGTGMPYINAAKTALLDQISRTGVDFSIGSRWQNHIIRDQSPSFEICQWLARLFRGYDYIKTYFTSGERDSIEQWMMNAAIFWLEDLNHDLNLSWSDRFTNVNPDNYTITSYGNAVGVNNFSTDRVYDGRTGIRKKAYFINNRRFDVILFSLYVGLSDFACGNVSSTFTGKTKNQLLVDSSKIFYREYLHFAVFSDGYTAENYRGDQDQDPSKAFHYSGISLSLAGQMADAAARSGDKTWYEYSLGKCTLKQAVDRFVRYYDSGINGNNVTYLNIPLNGTFENRQFVTDVYFAPLNLYWQDDDLWARIRRLKANLPSYSLNVASSGSNIGWDGPGGTYCGKLFMCDFDEGVPLADRINPYRLST